MSLFTCQGGSQQKAEDELVGMVRVCARAPHVGERRGAWRRLVGSQPRARWEQGRVKGHPCPAEGRRWPVHPSSRRSSAPARLAHSTAAPLRVKASNRLLGLRRGLSTRSPPWVLLLPWVRRGVGAEVLAAAVRSGKLSEPPRARDLFCPLPYNLGNETFLPVLLHRNCLNCQFFGIGIIHP